MICSLLRADAFQRYLKMIDLTPPDIIIDKFCTSWEQRIRILTFILNTNHHMLPDKIGRTCSILLSSFLRTFLLWQT